ncbi:MAG: hypothetical protein ACLFNN_00880 [Candidatus Paceibacterota bacterium]
MLFLTILGIIALAIVFFLVTILTYVKIKGRPKKTSTKSTDLSKYKPNGRLITAVLAYGCLLYLTREIQPEIWNWLFETGLFWPLQLAVVVTVIVIDYGTGLLKLIFIPIVIAIIFFSIQEIEKNGEKEKVTAKKPAVEESEIRDFLENPKPPKELKKLAKKGKIEDLRLALLQKVDSDSWSDPVKMPEQPVGTRLRADLEILSGRVLVRDRNEIIGVYPDKNYKHPKGNSFELRFKSYDHKETAIAVWTWKENL